MTFRVNSMTFKIDPARLEHMPDCRLAEEYNEFLRWFTENVTYMSPEESAAGEQLIIQIREIMTKRERSRQFYIDPKTTNDTGAQLSFFPAR